jgi:hypothetical protein
MRAARSYVAWLKPPNQIGICRFGRGNIPALSIRRSSSSGLVQHAIEYIWSNTKSDVQIERVLSLEIKRLGWDLEETQGKIRRPSRRNCAGRASRAPDGTSAIYMRDPNDYVVELTANTGVRQEIMDPAFSKPHEALAWR